MENRMKPYVKKLLNSVTATGAGTEDFVDKGVKTFQVYGTTSSGTGSATVKMQGSNDQVAWDDLDTGMVITLATTVAAGIGDGYTSDDRYAFVRANVTAISGTGASVVATVSY